MAEPRAEAPADEALVRRLLASQHPDLADLPIAAPSHGWDNHVFRLGDSLAVRLPRRRATVSLLAHEMEWLPQIASNLPAHVPLPVRRGEPESGFPWPWSIVEWVDGTPASLLTGRPEVGLAADLARFLIALHKPAPDTAPVNGVRGVPLRRRDHSVRERLATSASSAALLDVWGDAVTAPLWEGDPLWLHGDLHSGNVLVDRGRLTGVIDFGDMTAGDPATDLAVAWFLFDPQGRRELRERYGADADTWRRARGWALAIASALVRPNADSALARAGATALREVVSAD